MSKSVAISCIDQLLFHYLSRKKNKGFECREKNQQKVTFNAKSRNSVIAVQFEGAVTFCNNKQLVDFMTRLWQFSGI